MPDEIAKEHAGKEPPRISEREIKEKTREKTRETTAELSDKDLGMVSGGQGPGGKVTTHDISITKHIDK